VLKNVLKNRMAELIFIISLIPFLAISCGKKESVVHSSKPVKARAFEAALTEIPQKYEFTGSIEGDKRIQLSTKIMGQITYMPFQEGAKVTKGETLIKIRSDDLEAKKSQVQANMSEAEAAFKNTEANYNRIKSLYESKSATRKEMDDSEMAYNMGKAKIEAIKEMEREVNDHLSYTQIASPINGYVVQKMSEEGNIAAPGMPILTIEGLSRLKVVTKVPESQVYLFKTGDQVKVIVDALSGKEFSGSVEQINPGGNPASRQFEVKILLDESKSMLKSGMYAKVILERGTRHVITVPEDWVIKRGQLEGLFTMNSNQEAMLRWVRTGKRFGNQVEILSGLSQGEQVLISMDSPIRDGQKVEVAQ